MSELSEVIPLFEKLVGSKVKHELTNSLELELFVSGGLNYSQFNEVLLLCGFNRCSYEFFQFLVDGTYKHEDKSVIKTFEHFEKGVERFLKMALKHYGNVKYAYKLLSSDSEELYYKIGDDLPLDESDLSIRRDPLINITEIPPNKTYYLGYIIEGELKKRLKDNPDDTEALEISEDRRKYLEIAKENQMVYLASNHLDIYVATSMRLKHEFLFVNKTIDEVFNNPKLKRLKLRYFDPTQAYCDERIDKGLSEALMLKNAECTLYLAQETETLGKDSELASTLAQGKVVVAYIPTGSKDYIDSILEDLKELSPVKSQKELVLDQLMIFDSSLAWNDKDVKYWVNNIDEVSLDEMKVRLYEIALKFYDKKAETLTENHPLGIQVDLKTGVANGVLVVRNTKDCVNLIYNILLNKMEYYIKYKTIEDKEYIYLKEKISDCVFRLKTGDDFLSNSFWNFYNK